MTTTNTKTRSTRKNTLSNSSITARHVLWFIPNVIGYFRILCTLTALTLMIMTPNEDIQQHGLAIGLYILSFAADLVDGWAARKFQQTSQFGGMLDMITDRCSTMGLLYVLGTQESDMSNQLTFLLLMILDISSHWCQMYSTCLISQGHHKSRNSNAGRNMLVQWYYHYYSFFAYLCVGAEFTYIFTYILRHLPPPNTTVLLNRREVGRSSWWYAVAYTLLKCLWYGCIPGCVLKQIVNVAQLSSACHAVARFDALQVHRERSGKILAEENRAMSSSSLDHSRNIRSDNKEL